ncbi:MAG: RluA family pseudouridine synthase [Anaerolineales bacterium]|nr:RluA family pseudouridine synthase [Anaerolineales bacterium]MCL4259206.1 RluA family pseudouridine synthase [Anaerolineales bacterium]
MSERILHFRFERETNERLDKFLVESLPEFSRSRIQGLIAAGYVDVNGRAARKTGQLLEAGTALEVRIPPPVQTEIIAEQIPLDVVFENDDLLVVNKPAGMVVHPAVGHSSGTLVNAVLGYDAEIEGIGGEERPGVVHRLDKDTSGLILLAKNERAHRWLQDQFRLRRVEKTYLALVDGKPPTSSGRVETYIGRDPRNRKRMANVSASRGREAISEYKTLENFKRHTLLEFHPFTGRTHQIRLHCAFLKCPIAGDEVYGRKSSTILLSRHFLHAAELQIILPGETTERTFEAALPDDLRETLGQLRKEN